jgi:uncharacterized membrane protein (DUF4010 family)
MVVVTLLSIQTVAHIVLRTVGERIGGALSGFLSGFVSSTATFAAMAVRARDSLASVTSSVSGALMSQVASMVQLAAMVALLKPVMLGRVLLSVGLGAAVILAASAWMLRHAERSDEAGLVRTTRMFNPLATLALVALLSIFTLLVGWTNEVLGAHAANVTASLAAIVDLHAAAAAVLSMSTNAQVTEHDTMTALLLMLTINAAGKAIISFSGRKPFFWRVLVVLSAALLACWLPQLARW